MSKESRTALECACGQRIQFTEQHWPHCKANPDNMSTAARKNLPFTKAQLADIATHGVQQDKPISRRGKRVKA